jgi:S-DNA-T family DNA segregation ATPase FtsK/SpoIIIE
MPATTTRRRSPARSKSRKPAPKRKPAARTRSKATAAAAAPGVVARSRAAAGRQLDGHWGDVGAVALIVAGVICTLGLTSDLAGPVGRALADGTGAAFGRGRVAVPVACFAFAVLLLWPHRTAALGRAADRAAARDADPDADAEAPTVAGAGEIPTVRIAIGAVLLFVADLGILHLAYGRPAVDGPIDALRGAGGLLGAAIGAPLAAATGAVGAVVVLAGFALVGLVLALGLSIGAVVGVTARATGRVAGRAATKVRDGMNDGFGVGGAPAGDAVLFDDEADGGPDLAIDLVALEAEPEPEPRGEPDAGSGPDAEAEAAAPAFYEADGGQMAIAVGDDAPVRQGPWKLPPANILKRGSKGQVDRSVAEDGGKVLQATLAEHGVDARLIGMTVGPSVTQYALDLGPGVKVNRVTGLQHDIQYAMASPDVRILAPIPGRSAIGVEVPNKKRELVTLGDVLAAPEAHAAQPTLAVGLGRDIEGRSVMMDLATLPHVLIAGATGAGKSSCINSLVTSLLMRCTPDQVRLILVDPKRVELGAYNDLPHLLTQVVTNPKKAANALDWAVREMDMRYELLAEVGVRDITGYNAMFDRDELPTKDDPDPATGKGYDRLPFIVIVVDELNDLMMVAARDVEASICRIAQMARAVGIHLVIATQRPSVDVITGVIKANVPSRLAFSVSSLADSRVILDQAGAEKLIGMGDMLLLTASSSRAQRIQGSWVDEECVRKVVAHWRRQTTAPAYVEGLAGDDAAGGGGAKDDDGDGDDLLDEAMELVVRSGLGSTSMLQRKLRVGFSRAGRLMDLLERKGVVGPSEGSKARAVLMTVEEFEELHPPA